METETSLLLTASPSRWSSTPARPALCTGEMTGGFTLWLWEACCKNQVKFGIRMENDFTIISLCRVLGCIGIFGVEWPCPWWSRNGPCLGNHISRGKGLTMNKQSTDNIEAKAHPANNEYKLGRRDNFQVEETFNWLQEDGQSECQEKNAVEESTL